MAHICGVYDSRRLQIYQLRGNLLCVSEEIPTGKQEKARGVAAVIVFGRAGIFWPYIFTYVTGRLTNHQRNARPRNIITPVNTFGEL